MRASFSERTKLFELTRLDSANIHLETYTDERDFYARLYPRYLELLSRAAQFINETQATEEKTIIFIR